MTEAMELIALAIATGSAVVPAVEGVAEVLGGRRETDLARVAAALAWGYDDRAWEAAGAEWEPVHRALALAQRAGVPPADLLTTAAADLRRDRCSRLETAAARLGVRLVLPLGLLFLPAFILTTVLPLVLALATGVLLSP
ncbi:type II secretion system F family protein [Ornithinicoccus hortensis]|uniref:type II secretion system F family protein n=1 Tax=Ornithinicoccus hortensis TaxID=82346 RepID=UPI00147831F6|nr:type II secretion system F family protein [Ornithinicoccus hortensis]